MTQRHWNATATASEIRAILGPVDDDVITAIINTGATRSDVMQASQWLETGEHKVSARNTVCEVYDILISDRNRFLPDD